MKVLIVFFTLVVLVVGGNEFKRYDIESGYLKYKINTSSSSNDVKIEIVGTRTVKFKNYGAKEIAEEEVTSTQSLFDKTTTKKIHKVTLIDGDKIYAVDFNQKIIYQMGNLNKISTGISDRNMQDLGLDMLKKMGAKKTGSSQILGYDCDVWEVSGMKMCLYKGILLKLEMNIAGIKTEENAVEVKFNVNIDDSEFKLPNFPKKDIFEMMKQMEKGMMNIVQ